MQKTCQYACLRATNTISYLESRLENSFYFAGEQLTLAEISAGTLVYRLPDLGIDLTDYPKLKAWSARLLSRPTWRQIALSAEEWNNFKRRMKLIPKILERRRRLRTDALYKWISSH